MKGRTRASIAGMTLGGVIVTALALAAGIELFPALAMSLVGLAFGGWLAERQYESDETGSIRDDARSV
jgi:superfamily II helicase